MKKRLHVSKILIHPPMIETCFLLNIKHVKNIEDFAIKWLSIIDLSINKRLHLL